MTPQLIAIAIQELPSLIGLLREAFVKHAPTEPVPTDEQVLAAFEQAFQSSRAKDQAWLAAHPAPPTP